MTLAKTAVFTIVSHNYMHFARCLMQSISEVHPEMDQYVLLADENNIGDRKDNFKIVRLDDIFLPHMKKFLFRYTILELNTAVKPWMFVHLLKQKNYDKVIYFDPDIYVFRNISIMLDLLNNGSHIVLTPHLTRPLEVDFKPGEKENLLSGIYNLGFLAVSNNQKIYEFLSWWQSKLEYSCIADPKNGIFVDQKWLDLAPALFDGVSILRDAGYNVAYWNLPQRNIVKKNEGYFVNDVPLVFFHFSGIKPANPVYLTKHWDNPTKIKDIGEAKELVLSYCARLFEMGLETYSKINYAYNYFENGRPIYDFMRFYYRNTPSVQNALGDNPFQTGFDFFSSSAIPEKSGMSLVTHCMKSLYQASPDLQEHFPDIKDRDRNAYVNWFIDTNTRKIPIHNDYIRPAKQSFQRILTSQSPRDRIAFVYRKNRFRMKQLSKSIYYKMPAAGKKRIRELVDRMPGGMQRLIYSIAPPDSRGTPSNFRGHKPPLSPSSCQSLFGINFIGYASAETGTGESVRAAARAAIAAGIPFSLKDVSLLCRCNTNDKSFPICQTEAHPYYYNIFHINADMAPAVQDLVGNGFYKNRYNIGFWAWELSEFPEKWLSSFQFLDEIWAPSYFTSDAIARKSSIPVIRMPHAIQLPDSSDANRTDFGLNKNRFYFLTMIDCHSFLERKNPFAVIKAFQRAFSGDPEVCLMIKLNHAMHFNNEINIITKAAKDNPNIILIEKTMTRKEVAGLMSVCDAFISLHRSEGFGLCMAEAMALGKPVVATQWSGNMDFMTSENACLVRYRLVPVDQDIGPYEKGNLWADPDTCHAAEYMKKLVVDHEYRQNVSMRAQENIRNHFSEEAVGKRMIDRLRLLYPE